MDSNIFCASKGISVGELNHKPIFLRRKRLTDITNLSMGNFSDKFVPDKLDDGKTRSPVMVSEYIAKLLKENNVLMMALTERNAEVQNLRLMVEKLNQQNWQFAHAHSQMLAELNLGKDRLKAAQHELGCTSTALKVKTQELEEQKKLNKKLNLITPLEQKKLNKKKLNLITPSGGGCINPVEIATNDTTSQLASHKQTCLPNRKRRQRSHSLVSMSTTDQATNEENRRKLVRRKSINLRSENLFEIEDAKFPLKDGGNLSTRTTPILSEKEERKEIQGSLSIGRSSLGRPLRKAAEKVNCYKEMPLNAKLRRSE